VVQVPKGVVDLIEGDADVSGEPPNNPFPLLRCDHSIYVLPGVPHLLVHQFGLLRAALANGAACTSTHVAFHAGIMSCSALLYMQMTRRADRQLPQR